MRNGTTSEIFWKKLGRAKGRKITNEERSIEAKASMLLMYSVASSTGSLEDRVLLSNTSVPYILRI